MESGLRGMPKKTQGKELGEPGSEPRGKVPREEVVWKERHLQAGYYRTKESGEMLIGDGKEVKSIF